MIFMSAAIFLNKSPSKIRFLVGGFIAALLYCLSILVPILSQLPFYIYDFLIPIIPIVIIYKVKNYKEFFKTFIACHFASFLIGGAIWNGYYMFLSQGKDQNLSLVLVLGIGTLVLMMLYGMSAYIRRRFIMPHFEYIMTLSHKGKQICVNGFLDSGNCLYTLTTHKPVTVMTYEAASELLSTKEKELIQIYQTQGIEGLLEKRGHEKVYLIPYESVGCKSDILVGFMMEKIILEKGMFQKTLDHCVVGIVSHELFGGQDYKALIHPDYMMVS